MACVWGAKINQLDLINYFWDDKENLKATVLFFKNDPLFN